MSKHTPKPWRWQGEDYRGGWGWMMLVGPHGEGLIVGQAIGGGPSPHLRGFTPVDPALCITGLAADGKPHAEGVHVFSEANARLIVNAPVMFDALDEILTVAQQDNAALALARIREIASDLLAEISKTQ